MIPAASPLKGHAYPIDRVSRALFGPSLAVRQRRAAQRELNTLLYEEALAYHKVEASARVKGARRVIAAMKRAGERV